MVDAYVNHALSGAAVPEAERPMGPQEWLFGGMTELQEPDLVQGVPIFPVELRSFGRSKISFGELRADSSLLSQWANEAHTGALEAQQGVFHAFAPIAAAAPTRIPARPVAERARDISQRGMQELANMSGPYSRAKTHLAGLLTAGLAVARQGQQQAVVPDWGQQLLASLTRVADAAGQLRAGTLQDTADLVEAANGLIACADQIQAGQATTMRQVVRSLQSTAT